MFTVSVLCEHNKIANGVFRNAAHRIYKAVLFFNSLEVYGTQLLTYLLTYLLTPWSRVLLEKLTGFAANQ